MSEGERTKRLKRKTLSVEMDEELWTLLERFHFVLNWKLKAKGWPRVRISRVAGAILAHYLLTHEREILEDVSRQKLGRILRRAGRILSKQDLEAASRTVGTDLSELCRSRSS
jgi:hypothetical protein